MILPKIVASARTFASSVRTGGAPVRAGEIDLGTGGTPVGAMAFMTRAALAQLRRHVSAVALLVVLSLSGIAPAQVLVQSTFNADTQGWTAFSVTTGICEATLGTRTNRAVTWIATGGSTGGFLRHAEFNGTSFFRASALFRGNQSAAYGGSISCEQRWTTTDNRVYYALDDMIILGGGITLYADTHIPSRDAWGQTRIPLLPGYWKVGSCNGPVASEPLIRAALADVTDILIRAENDTGNEVSELDTVVLDATPVNESCKAVWSRDDQELPTGRWRHAVAVDSDRNVLVLFGGDTGENDTWEYSLTSGVWTRFQPSNSPSRRGGHAMAYDIARQRIVMTGGGYIVATAEVWEYDAQTHTWSQAPDLTDAQGLPLPRSGHAMSYDSTRNTMVLYGGLDAGVNGSLDVLERPSTTSTWSVRTATLNPGPQVGYAMAYDEERQLSVLIGEGTTAISVWEWDGAAGTWTPRSFTGSIPNARTNPAVVFDSARSRIVLAGGQANRNTWDYDGTTWVQRALIPSNGRDEHAMAYDPFNGRCLLYGGILNSATPQRDMLAFDGATNTWTTAWSRSDLGPRDLFGLCYDEVGGRSIVQGGALVTRAGIVQQFGAATFAFSGDAWTVPAATGSPGTRFFHPLVYDSSRRAVLMYGGATSNGSSNATARLWELNLASMTWSDLGVQAPGQRYDHAAAFDRVRNKMVIQGGIDDLGVRKGDTWIYDVTAGSWTQHPDSEPNPGLRNGAGMAFDEHRGVVVLFGGQIGTSGQYDNSTWEWNGTAWANVTPPNGNPPARVRLEMVYDPVRRTVVMFGGRMNSNNDFDVLHVGRAYRDLWEWDGIAWKRLAIESGPAPIGFVNARATYDRSRSRILHHGGASVDNRTYDNGQTWGLIMPSPTCGGPTCDSIDFNNDTSLFDPQDIEAFLSVYSEGPCVPSGATCGDIDFNNDTSVFDPCDINSFLVVYSEGPCTPCGT